MLILQMRILRCKGVKELAQGLTSSKYQRERDTVCSKHYDSKPHNLNHCATISLNLDTMEFDFQ
jgi:hypothetical protein